MPTYAYACTACDHRFEVVQSFSDDSLTVCPECGGRLRKVFNAVGIVFKGGGFYRTDSRTGTNGSSSSGSTGGSEGSGTKSSGASSTDSSSSSPSTSSSSGPSTGSSESSTGASSTAASSTTSS